MVPQDQSNGAIFPLFSCLSDTLLLTEAVLEANALLPTIPPSAQVKQRPA